MNDQTNAIEIAKIISDYLITGMHHSTPQGQAEIASIIQNKIKSSS